MSNEARRNKQRPVTRFAWSKYVKEYHKGIMVTPKAKYKDRLTPIKK